METISLKALAYKVLERNLKGNFSETTEKPDGNFEGKISPINRVAYKVYSEILQAYLWVVYDSVVYDSEDMKVLREQGVTEAIYTRHDIAELKKLPKEALKDIHRVKEVFKDSKIKHVLPNKEI